MLAAFSSSASSRAPQATCAAGTPYPANTAPRPPSALIAHDPRTRQLTQLTCIKYIHAAISGAERPVYLRVPYAVYPRARPWAPRRAARDRRARANRDEKKSALAPHRRIAVISYAAHTSVLAPRGIVPNPPGHRPRAPRRRRRAAIPRANLDAHTAGLANRAQRLLRRRWAGLTLSARPCWPSLSAPTVRPSGAALHSTPV